MKGGGGRKSPIPGRKSCEAGMFVRLDWSWVFERIGGRGSDSSGNMIENLEENEAEVVFLLISAVS